MNPLASDPPRDALPRALLQGTVVAAVVAAVSFPLAYFALFAWVGIGLVLLLLYLLRHRLSLSMLPFAFTPKCFCLFLVSYAVLVFPFWYLLLQVF